MSEARKISVTVCVFSRLNPIMTAIFAGNAFTQPTLTFMRLS